ncbi:hypothetical protein EJ07DRAFT_157653 [Lizonia empirigonia]|nr:hypothetical protein EJ07DRAFT_157653 [Lizonia empirigonia]
MYATRFILVLAGLGATQIVPFDYTLPVLYSPVIQIKAGQDMNYQLANSRNATCQATLSFSNDTFLSMSTIVKPRNCAGDQIAVLKIPYSVPNGAAGLEWQCSGTDGTSVNLLIISGGLGDPERLTTDSEGPYLQVHCRKNATGVENKSSNNSCV